MDNPIFTTKINATNSGILRDFDHRWRNVFSKRKKESIKLNTPKEIERLIKIMKFSFWF
jgi:hypothetical protein